MKRATVFPGSIPRSLDLLKTNQFAMVGLAKLSQDVFGSDTVATGLACTPTAPASLNVLVAPGNIYALANLEGTAYSSLPADTAHQILKQGVLLDASTLACPAPTTSGQSINYLIQATFQEVDTDPLVLPYYNANIPAQPYSGPNNDGSANYTTREGTLILSAKAGASAATGSQVTPAPDSGCIGLWSVTVAFGATTIAAGNIGAYSGSPLLPGSVLDLVATAKNYRGSAVITSSVSWTVPADVYRLKYTLTGGGGGSIGCQASSTSQLFSGAGGGAGGTCIGYMDVVPGQVIAIVIGAGGSPGAVSSAGTGGNSSIGAIIAHGGAGASLAGATSSAGGIGGVAAGADMNIAGGDGSDGQSGTFLLSGNGGASFWGGGGRAGLAGSHAGVAWGSGAGGVYDSALSGTAYTGASGAQGVALLEW